MGSRRRSPLPLLVLVCYTLSLTASGWFHDHHHVPSQKADCSGAHCADHATTCDHGSAGLGQSHRAGQIARSARSQSPSIEDGACAVCQFLSQRTVGESRVVEVVCQTLVEHVALLEPVVVVHTPVICCQIRAPPAAA